jgi:hypothetical protein
MASRLEPETDPCWLALRYVSGEMGRDEAEVFERLLDQDQGAREAVSEAVALAGAIAALSPPDRSVLPMPIALRPVPALLGLVSIAAACLAWLFFGPHGPSAKKSAPGDRVAATSMKPSVSVTLAWSTLRQEREGEDGEANELLAWNGEEPGLPEPEVATPSEAEGASDHGLSPWLLDAASLVGRPGHLAAPVKER